MQVCILCPGPSLAELESVPACDLSIAVNRAALKFAAAYWAALDYQTFTRDEPYIKGNPQLLTRREYRPLTHRHGFDFEDVYPLPNPAGSYYTTPAAMALAAHIGATRITIYGCDWAVKQPDFDGITPAHSLRNAFRFDREREQYDAMVRWLNTNGITVERNGTTGRSG